jgi:formamidopyrimidine-DNA glycosylase
MPELPEVETYRLYLEGTSLHQPVESLEVERKKLLTTDLDALQTILKGNEFTGTSRIGKHLLVHLKRGGVLVLHFGMTGDLGYYREEEDRPRFTRAVFHFRNGYKLAFIDSRIFGQIGWAESVEAYRQQRKLGPDALDITKAELGAAIGKRKAPLKPVLLDQSVTAGIGNWIVDEVLFQARLHPERPASSLTETELAALHKALRHVLKTAISKEAVYRHFPKSFLIHAREWDNSPHPEGSSHHLNCPRCQTEILKMVVGGRATYVCPLCQPNPNSARLES